MEEKKVIPTWVTVVFMLLTIGSLVINFLSFTQDFELGTEFVIQRGIACWALILALLYGLTGYSKKSATMFKVFCSMASLSAFVYLFVRLINFDSNVVSYVAYGASLISFAIITVFTFSKDLGKVKSYTFCAIFFVCTIVDTVCQPMISVTYFLAAFSRIVLVIVLLLMVYAKYKDKAQRGTK